MTDFSEFASLFNVPKMFKGCGTCSEHSRAGRRPLARWPKPLIQRPSRLQLAFWNPRKVS